MSRWLKLMIGASAALAAGVISHGPMGRGEAFVSALEAQARAEIAKTELSGVSVRMQRDPLARIAVLSGNANDFQREGMGLLPGINDRVRDVPGIASIRWDETDCCARR